MRAECKLERGANVLACVSHNLVRVACTMDDCTMKKGCIMKEAPCCKHEGGSHARGGIASLSGVPACWPVSPTNCPGLQACKPDVSSNQQLPLDFLALTLNAVRS
eukprot:417659-Pelagomonas_calceolata.AAC.1